MSLMDYLFKRFKGQQKEKTNYVSLQVDLGDVSSFSSPEMVKWGMRLTDTQKMKV